jgi:REP element-mobilizing transposase RayT
MGRAGRSFEEGRIYHLYNRLGGGSMELGDEELAATFVALLRTGMRRDGAAVFAWCLLGNHYHLIVRQGPVPLSRTMKALQQGVTRTRNLRQRVFGPLWQGRFKAKEVLDESYLMQLIAYVHLNPVKAGLAENADSYRWSGHRDIVGRRRDPIVAVDEALLVYGETRRRALRAYRSAIAAVAGEEWSDEAPGKLPWWRLGRPTEEERLLRRREGAFVDELGRSTARWRPRYPATEWLELACTHLGCHREELGGRGRAPEVVRMRDLIALVGIERYGVKVTELAAELGKSRDGVSRWCRRGAARRAGEPDFAAAAEALDQAASEDP